MNNNIIITQTNRGFPLLIINNYQYKFKRNLSTGNKIFVYCFRNICFSKIEVSNDLSSVIVQPTNHTDLPNVSYKKSFMQK